MDEAVGAIVSAFQVDALSPPVSSSRPLACHPHLMRGHACVRSTSPHPSNDRALLLHAPRTSYACVPHLMHPSPARAHYELHLCPSRSASVPMTSCICAHHELHLCPSRVTSVPITSCICAHPSRAESLPITSCICVHHELHLSRAAHPRLIMSCACLRNYRLWRCTLRGLPSRCAALLEHEYCWIPCSCFGGGDAAWM